MQKDVFKIKCTCPGGNGQSIDVLDMALNVLTIDNEIYWKTVLYIKRKSFTDFLISVTTQIQLKNTIQMTIFLSFFFFYHI